MGQRLEKKLRRILPRLLDHNLILSQQHDGSYLASLQGRNCARLNAAEAKQACAMGIFQRAPDHNLCPTDDASSWLKRQCAAMPETAFSEQHRDMRRISVIDSEGRLHQVQKNMAESPLAWLYTHKDTHNLPFLSATEFAAGERFREDYAHSSLSQKLCADWEAPAPGHTARGPRNAVLDATDNALAAKDRFMEALNALGPGLDDLIFSLCIRESSLEAIENAKKWPKRTAKVVVKLALDRLAHHYGLLR